MKHAFAQMTLVDRAPGMLEVSRALNPDVVHVQGDLRDVRIRKDRRRRRRPA